MACLEGGCLVVVHEVLSVGVWELDSIIGSCTSAHKSRHKRNCYAAFLNYTNSLTKQFLSDI